MVNARATAPERLHSPCMGGLQGLEKSCGHILALDCEAFASFFTIIGLMEA